MRPWLRVAAVLPILFFPAIAAGVFSNQVAVWVAVAQFVGVGFGWAIWANGDE